jgi:hypothetical protein
MGSSFMISGAGVKRVRVKGCSLDPQATYTCLVICTLPAEETLQAGCHASLSQEDGQGKVRLIHLTLDARQDE